MSHQDELSGESFRDQPFDAVVTWVDGNDPKHRAKREAVLSQAGLTKMAGAGASRFEQSDEIGFCIRSLIRFAPWLRHIYIVTDGQVPAICSQLASSSWAERITVVDHRTVFRGHESVLPCFNSVAIESVIWRIPGLSNHFLYLNDDFFLVREVSPDVFFRGGGMVTRGQWRPRSLVSDVKVMAAKMAGALGWQTHRRSGYYHVQEQAARLAGSWFRYFSVKHNPHPVNVQLLRQYFEQHEKLLIKNISHRVRHIDQFWPIALSTHLALKHGLAEIDKTGANQTLRLHTGKLTQAGAQQAIDDLENHIYFKFLCLQGLESAQPNVKDMLLNWLDRQLKPIDQAMSEARP